MEIYNDWFAKSALRHFAAGLGFHDSILLGLGKVYPNPGTMFVYLW